MKQQLKTVATVLLSGTMSLAASAQTFSDADLQKVQAIVDQQIPAHMGIGKVRAHSLATKGDTVVVNLTENFGDIPFTRESVAAMASQVQTALGEDYKNRPIRFNIAGNNITNYFSEFKSEYKRKHAPFISEVNDGRHYKRGLDGNIIAVWPSHGWYFENSLNRWEWQRARMFQTVEDMYTHSYVIPFLMPMLENAGAYVWDARERDTHPFTSIVDNDGGKAQTSYSETSNGKQWATGQGKGFAWNRDDYRDWQNPFDEGTYRMAETSTNKKKLSRATWSVTMPEAGEYALYISYKSLPNSTSAAHYTVNSLGGSREFVVNQKMAGGVWVYLGTFELAKGLNQDVVVLTNQGSKNEVVTADAIKVGGGMACISRKVAEPTPENVALAKEQENESKLGQEGVKYDYVSSSNHPWFHLGSRYYLQWAGFPPSVYSPSNGINDYTDDYRSRGVWVNYLAGGSEALPNQPGLNVPVDLSFCLHTDAGTTQNDDIIGTLLIYCTKEGSKYFGKYANGTPRELSRQLANNISTQVVGDIRAKYEPNWKRRGMWDKSYYEARVPEVPAVLMELLSHQNFADMKFGLDPNFRFDVSRAIYKGMLKFIAQRDHRDYQVQPLPVNSFGIAPVSQGTYELKWKPTHDALADNADPDRYIVLERVGADGGFKEIGTTRETAFTINVADNQIHSYRVVAVNEGGRSFESETLSLGIAPQSKGTVAVVNDFTRVSGPDWFDSGKMAGFADEKDHGVPYKQQINFLGSQYEFERKLPWVDDDDPGFGACRSDHETQNVAGNTFDYATVHGEAIMAAGYSFFSVSEQAAESGLVNLDGTQALDIILGKQKQCKNGRGAKPDRYKIFTPAFMQMVSDYTQKGGSVLMTGAYVSTDIWYNDSAVIEAEKTFAKQVMGYQHRASQATTTGSIYSVPSTIASLKAGLQGEFQTRLNDKTYAVESPDAITPSDKQGVTYLRYGENNKPAAVASDRGTYRTVVAGFPFETLTSPSAREALMGDVLNFLIK